MVLFVVFLFRDCSMPTTRMLNRVRTALNRLSLLRPDTLVVVAVSGGPDSLCLLHLLWRLRDETGLSLHVAHLDHCFRGEESAAEAHFVADTARAWNIPATIEQSDVLSLVQHTGQNKQATARAVRYAFLAQVAQRTRASAVAVAHQADDQAETLLLHLLRGAGPAGLRGMREAVPWHEWAGHLSQSEDEGWGAVLIRPLLSTTRAEITAYCTQHELEPRHDPSNASPHYTRNRIRTGLLPHMALYNQHILTALAHTAQICSDDYAYMQLQLDTLWTPDLVEERPDAIRFSIARWKELPSALQRYALRRAASRMADSDDIGYESIEAGRTAYTRGTGCRQSLGNGLLLHVGYGTFTISRCDKPAGPFHGSLPQMGEDTLPLAVPGVTPISESWSLICSFEQPADLPEDGRWRWWATLDADVIDRNGQPVLRRRQSGDRFQPAGGRGSRSLQNFFVDQKVPRDVRAAWPLLATPTALVWVVGIRTDARFQAGPETVRCVWVVARQENDNDNHTEF